MAKSREDIKKEISRLSAKVEFLGAFLKPEMKNSWAALEAEIDKKMRLATVKRAGHENGDNADNLLGYIQALLEVKTIPLEALTSGSAKLEAMQKEIKDTAQSDDLKMEP